MTASNTNMHMALSSPGVRVRTNSLSGLISTDPKVLELWTELSKEKPFDEKSIQERFVFHCKMTLARSKSNMDLFAAYQSLALSSRDQLLNKWNLTQKHQSSLLDSKPRKRVYYLSLEFLIGRSLDNALLNMGVKDICKGAISKLGFNIEDLVSEESDAALGNGGLGRLAACFMDSLATLDMPAWGYGIRYNYGIFEQQIVDGYQIEHPDYWLTFGNPWEIQRLDIAYDITFGGKVITTKLPSGKFSYRWEPHEKVVAVAYDYPIPGYSTNTCINIRLWSSVPFVEFDFASFNSGDYEKAVEQQNEAEKITSVLYPNDNFDSGKELRLKQQYFFVSATLQDIIRRFKKTNDPWTEFPNQVAIQLNDTHPTIGIIELQRILVDEEGLDFDMAWGIVTQTYSYTNHTVLPEALEKWSVPLMGELLPRHLQLIFEINLFFLQSVEKKHPGDRFLLQRMSIIEEGSPQFIRMATLAVVCCHKVNGVAELHSELVQKNLFPDFVQFFGKERFTNVTNGVTSRRWLHQANPDLSKLITETLKSQNWLKDLSLLKNLLPFAKDAVFQQKWIDIKQENKKKLAAYILEVCGIHVDPTALFDVQCKRLHEYKRQFMNILAVIYRFEELQKMNDILLAKQVPRVVIFAGKSAPGYYLAKLIIKLINNASTFINANARTNKYLKLVFIPNYNVSVAELIIPASDISQHISTAGTEASGTSNMKFVLNGGLIIGTHDGANIEIMEEIGLENIYLFGTLTPQVEDIRHSQYYGSGLKVNEKLEYVLSRIRAGYYGSSAIFESLLVTLSTDRYLLHTDFDSYLETIARFEIDFMDKARWCEKTIYAASLMGKFSSDRSIKEYADKIWGIKAVPIP